MILRLDCSRWDSIILVLHHGSHLLNNGIRNTSLNVTFKDRPQTVRYESGNLLVSMNE